MELEFSESTARPFAARVGFPSLRCPAFVALGAISAGTPADTVKPVISRMGKGTF